ncbi:hypothetical protein M8J75_016495 [Diaphorina citri]|nr:hypothetical protein M8J75_016495 [Diaphorina citri]
MTSIWMRPGLYTVLPVKSAPASSMGDESSSEVTSSSSAVLVNATVPNLVSPTSSDIGEVDLEFWDLDLNNSHPLATCAPCRVPYTTPTSTRMTPSLCGDTDDASEKICIRISRSTNTVFSFHHNQNLPEHDRAPRIKVIGYHYNALTCEGCKGFFRRSITKNAVYQCKYGNSCEIDMYMRRKCQECRLKKCLSVGMRPECVVPEYQCAVKRKEKKAQKDKNKPNSTTEPSPEIVKTESNSQVSTLSLPLKYFKLNLIPKRLRGSNSRVFLQQSSDGASSRVSSLHSGTKTVSPEQEELIHRLVYFQNEYEHPSEEDIKKIVGDEPNTRDREFKHITEFTILTVQLIVEFAKRLPGFDKLVREDQISLLKACSSEVMMLRMARRYDAPSDSILFANNQPYTRDSYKSADMGETVDDLLKFCRLMYSMKVDNAEYALLTAIVIFSERPSLTEAWKVEKIQEIYLEALKAYVDNRVRHNSTTIFAKLLSVLTELRTLGNQNSELCFSFKLKNKKLPPFLAEIWDVIT